MGDFIREQIKEKPLSKKRILAKIGISALCGLIFAVVACAVFAVFYMTIGRQNQEGDQGTIAIDSETETQNVILNTETEIEPETETQVIAETEVAQETESVEETETIDVELKEFSIEDYQNIQNQFYEIGAEASRYIVAVTSVRKDFDWFNNTYDSMGTSAGVIVSIQDDAVYVLTEKKSIQNAKAILISFTGEEMLEASFVEQDGNTGIAVVKVDRASIPQSIVNNICEAKIDVSSMVYQGLVTIALGYPLGGGTQSILAGTITSKDNEVSTFDKNYRILNTDIICSASGSGVLINTSGNIVGFIRQDFGTSSEIDTITAIRITELMPVVNKLVAGEKIPYLGTVITPVTDKLSKENDLPKGIYVREAKVDSPAMLGGIQSGDIIIKINDRLVTNSFDYYDAILKLDLNEACTVTFMRQGATGYSELECEVKPGVLK